VKVSTSTEFDTIYTVILRLIQLVQNLNQKYIIIATDLPIYSKAQDLLLCNKPILSYQWQNHSSITRNAFNKMAFFIAPNSCKQVLEDKQYSRTTRALRLCADALFRLFFDYLKKWMVENRNEEFPTHYFVKEIKNGTFKEYNLKDLQKT
jgi:hypothetical protein